MKIDEVTRAQLEMAKKYCDDEDKSTEFMIEYMQDVANTNFDTVMAFLTEPTRE